MNKRIIIITIVVLILFGVLFFKIVNAKRNYNEIVDNFKPIYELLKDTDFETEKIDEMNVYLYEDNVKIGQYNLNEKCTTKILYIENRDTNMIFWISGFDDLEGIMFMKSEWSDEVWNGLRRIEKIQGNAYTVYTYN